MEYVWVLQTKLYGTVDNVEWRYSGVFSTSLLARGQCEREANVFETTLTWEAGHMNEHPVFTARFVDEAFGNTLTRAYRVVRAGVDEWVSESERP